MPLLLPVPEKATIKMTMLKVMLLAGCVEKKGVHSQSPTMVFGEKWPTEMPTNVRGTTGVPMCAMFYPKGEEELQEYRSPSLLFLRERKKAVRTMTSLGQTKCPFSPAPCLLPAQEQMFREECKNRTNIE